MRVTGFLLLGGVRYFDFPPFYGSCLSTGHGACEDGHTGADRTPHTPWPTAIAGEYGATRACRRQCRQCHGSPPRAPAPGRFAPTPRRRATHRPERARIRGSHETTEGRSWPSSFTPP